MELLETESNNNSILQNVGGRDHTLHDTQEVRLPDLVVMVHTKDKYQYVDHRGILSCNKVTIPTDCNSNMMTFLNLVKSAINLGKKKKSAEDIARDNEPVTNGMTQTINQSRSNLLIHFRIMSELYNGISRVNLGGRARGQRESRGGRVQGGRVQGGWSDNILDQS